jgi:hypothetical protein
LHRIACERARSNAIGEALRLKVKAQAVVGDNGRKARQAREDGFHAAGKSCEVVIADRACGYDEAGLHGELVQDEGSAARARAERHKRSLVTAVVDDDFAVNAEVTAGHAIRWRGVRTGRHDNAQARVSVHMRADVFRQRRKPLWICDATRGVADDEQDIRRFNGLHRKWRAAVGSLTRGDCSCGWVRQWRKRARLGDERLRCGLRNLQRDAAAPEWHLDNRHGYILARRGGKGRLL